MRRAALVFALLLASVAVSAGVTASPQPTPVCGVCGAGLEIAADGSDVPQELGVDRSVATVRVHEDGSATWRVTNHLANDSAVAYLQDNPRALDGLVADALSYSTVEGPFRNVSATIEGSTVLITFEDPDAARRMPGGVLVVEYLHTRGHQTWPVLTADRLTIVGPPGTTVTNSPPGAQVSGRNATWHGNASVRFYDAPVPEADAYVTFAEGGVGATLWTVLAVGLATAPIVFEVFTGILLPPLLVLAVGLLAVVAGGRRALGGSLLPDERSLGLGVAALGGAAFVLVALGSVVPAFEGNRWALEVGALYLAVGSVAAWRGPDTRLRDLLLAGLLAAVGVLLALAITLPGEYVTQSEALRRGFRDAVRLLPLLAMPSLGAAVSRGDRRVEALAALAVLAGFLLAQLTVVWPTQRPFGLVLIFFIGGAAGATLLGIPLFLLGGVSRRPDRSGGRSTIDAAGAD